MLSTDIGQRADGGAWPPRAVATGDKDIQYTGCDVRGGGSAEAQRHTAGGLYGMQMEEERERREWNALATAANGPRSPPLALTMSPLHGGDAGTGSSYALHDTRADNPAGCSPPVVSIAVDREEAAANERRAADGAPPVRYQYFTYADGGVGMVSIPRKKRTTFNDAEFHTMKHLDYYGYGMANRLFEWKMACLLVLIGFITTGLGSYSVYWLRDGCLIYKLYVLEGTGPDCCSTKYAFGMNYWDKFTPFQPYDRDPGAQQTTALTTLAPDPIGSERPLCAMLAYWPRGATRGAHIVALILLSCSLITRILAVLSYVRSGHDNQRSFPWLVGLCMLLEAATVLVYALRQSLGSVPGPGFWFVVFQFVLDFVALQSTQVGRTLDDEGKEVSQLKSALTRWAAMPRGVKFEVVYFMCGWVLFILSFALPWKTYERECVLDLSPWFARGECVGTQAFFLIKDWTTWAALLCGSIFLLITIICWALGTFFAWSAPTRFPTYAFWGNISLIMSVFLFGVVLTNRGRHRPLYECTCLYACYHMLFMTLLYRKYSSLIWSSNFTKRRTNPDFQQAERDDLRDDFDNPDGRKHTAQFMGGTWLRERAAPTATTQQLYPTSPMQSRAAHTTQQSYNNALPATARDAPARRSQRVVEDIDWHSVRGGGNGGKDNPLDDVFPATGGRLG